MFFRFVGVIDGPIESDVRENRISRARFSLQIIRVSIGIYRLLLESSERRRK